MSRLTRDGTAEPVSRDQILRHARGQGNIHFPCSADHEQDWQPYPVDPYSAIWDDHTYIHTRSPFSVLLAFGDCYCVYIAGTFNIPTSYQQWVWEREAHINWSMVICRGSTGSELP